MGEPKVQFFRGPESNIPEKLTDGAIYLTTDSKSLIFDVVALNERIRVSDIIDVDSEFDLPSPSVTDQTSFYYVKSSNKLFKCNGIEYVLINKDVQIATNTTLGVVKGTKEEDGISINKDGTMQVNDININKIVQNNDDELILTCNY